MEVAESYNDKNASLILNNNSEDFNIYFVIIFICILTVGAFVNLILCLSLLFQKKQGKFLFLYKKNRHL